ncbi:MAG: carbohydrate ABC transporter permease [Anaerolineae bacterium]
MSTARIVGRLARAIFITAIVAFYAAPLLWVVLTPFNPRPGASLEIPAHPTLASFQQLFAAPTTAVALSWNTPIISLGVTLVVFTTAALAAYAMSRGAIPAHGFVLYGLVLITAVVSGPAAMIPMYLIAADLRLLDSHVGVILVLAALLLPPAMYLIRGFLTGVPRSCEEAAQLAGASPLRTLHDVVLPLIRPGLVVVAVWVFVSAWGEFFVPFVLLRAPNLFPAALVIYGFRDPAGLARVPAMSAFALLYALPVIILYVFVSRRFGFRFFGGYRG